MAENTAYTDSLVGSFKDSVIEKLAQNPIRTTIRSASENFGQAVDGAAYATKLVLNQAGMIRSIARGGSRTSPENTSALVELQGDIGEQISLSEAEIQRYDSSKPYYFRCGEYFMPLSLSYNVVAEKNLAESQLIDGPNIIERVNKRRKIINVQVTIQFSEGGNLNAVKNAGVMEQQNNLTAMLNDLYENQDVFEISNEYINRELRVTHVVMARFTSTPGIGNTFMNMNMELYEVNMKANIIYDENAGVLNGFTLRPTFQTDEVQLP